MHPREFFGRAIKNCHEIKTDKKTFRVDTMPVAEFYLKIKIGNITKNLQQNESLNLELCLDPKTHPDLFNIKMFIRALEDIAEKEQEKLFEEEKAKAESEKNESLIQSPTSSDNKKDSDENKPSSGKDEDKPASPGSSPVKSSQGKPPSGARSPEQKPGEMEASFKKGARSPKN